MLNADVDSLGNDALPHLFVDNDSDGARVDVEDGPGSSVVVFVGHSFVDGSVDNDVNDVSVFVGGEGLRNVDGSVLLESLFEFVSGFAFVTVAVSHGLQIIINNIINYYHFTPNPPNPHSPPPLTAIPASNER